MRSEHKLSAWEVDAFSRWRRFYSWRPGERKGIKRLAHRRDRRAAREAANRLRGEAG